MKKLAVVLMIVSLLTASVVIEGNQVINSIRVQGYRALKVFVQIKDSQIMTIDFLEYQTQHFVIKYRAEDEDIIRETAYLFEQSYDEAAEVFGHTAEDKSVIIIYKDQDEFGEYQNAIKGQAVMGLYNMGTIHILSPKAYINQTHNYMEYFEKNGPVLHEYTHKVVDEITEGNIELWLTEGLALYMENKAYDTEWAQGFVYKRYLTSDEMRDGFMYANEVLAYRQSYDMVKYLIDNYSMESMKLVLQKLGSGSSCDEVFMEAYGFTAGEFIDAHEYVK